VSFVTVFYSFLWQNFKTERTPTNAHILYFIMDFSKGAIPVRPKGPLTMEQLLAAPPSNIFEVRVGQAEVLRQAANEAYDQNRLDDAVKLYERALYLCNFDNATMKFELNEEHKLKVCFTHFLISVL
jgi:hypothetical protein